jgi:hypothetical protein
MKGRKLHHEEHPHCHVYRPYVEHGAEVLAARREQRPVIAAQLAIESKN